VSVPPQEAATKGQPIGHLRAALVAREATYRPLESEEARKRGSTPKMDGLSTHRPRLKAIEM